MFEEIRFCWKESFYFFKWQNLRLVILASLSSFWQAIVIFAKKLWFFVAILFGLQVLEIFNNFVFHFYRDASAARKAINPLIINLLSDGDKTILGSRFLYIGTCFSVEILENLLVIAAYFCFLFFILAVRLSAEIKDRAYFFKYSRFGLLLMGLEGLMILCCVVPVLLLPSWIRAFFSHFLILIPAFYLPFAVVTVLFWIDFSENFRPLSAEISQGAYASRFWYRLFFVGIKHSFIFCIYFFPVVSAVSLCSLASHYLFSVTLSERIAAASATMPMAYAVLVSAVILSLGVVLKAFLISVCVTFFVQLKSKHNRLLS